METPMLIRVDLFPTLGFSIAGIPINYLDSNIQSVLTEAEELELLVSKDPIEEENTDEFKQKQKEFMKQIELVLEEHEKSPLIQLDIFCTILESLIELPIPEDQNVY